MAGSSSRSNSRRTDPGWNYVTLVDEKNTNNTICNFCGKRVNGGIFRAKLHLTGTDTDVLKCEKVPKNVKEEITRYMTSKKKTKEKEDATKNTRKQRTREETLRSYADDNEDSDGLEHGSEQQNNEEREAVESGKRVKRGPLDCYLSHGKRPPAKNMKERKDANEAAMKELRNRACSAFARRMCDAGLSFKCCKV